MFAGLISKEQPVSAWGEPDKILAALAPYSLDKPRDVWATDKHLLVQVATRTGSTTAEIYRHQESGVVVAFWGRIDNRPDLIAQLDAEHKASNDELIALAWLKWGENCPEKLIGDFAFAIVSPRTGVVFLARDVMGVKPLYYRADDNGVFFANSAAAFKPLKIGALTHSEKWMAEYMLDLTYSHTETAYEEIKKLQGAHSLLIHADGRMNLRRYHQFIDNAPIEKKRDPKYLEAYRATWQEAVACRMPKTGDIGTENSGGLDSGSVTAQIAYQLGAEIGRLRGYGFCHQAAEPDCIMATAIQYGMHSNYLNSSWDFSSLETIPRQLHCFGYPMEYLSAYGHSPFYADCQRRSIGTLFSGFGGDEVVTNEGDYSEYEALAAKQYRAFYQLSNGSAPRRLARTFKRAIIGMPAEIRHSYLEVCKYRLQFNLLRSDLMQTYSLGERFFAKSTLHHGFSSMNVYAMHFLALPFIQSRVENCSLMAASYGLEYVWPMLDVRLLQQWLSTPSLWKLGDGGIRRYLHRCAVEGVCADKIVWKANKDMGFSEIEKHILACDNTPLFNSRYRLLNSMPSDLLGIIEKNQTNLIKPLGLSHKNQHVETYFSLVESNRALIGLSEWLRLDGSSHRY